jgi:hypothetical protein
MNPFNEDSKEDLGKEMELSVTFVKSIIEQSKELVPMAIGIAGKNRYVIPFTWKTREEKYDLVDKVKKEFRKLGVTAICFMTEAWMLRVRHPALYNPNVAPSEHPDRQEIAAVSLIDKGGIKGVVMPIIRTGGEVTLGEPIKSGGDISIVDNLWGDYFKGGE